MKHQVMASAALILLAACGGAGDDGGGSQIGAANLSDCPPQQKGNGMMVSSRYDYADLIEANKWRDEMFPRGCAESLANLVPDMPNGFGVKPTNKPYVMKDDQVYVAYARMPEPLYLESGDPNLPRDMEAIEYEIVRFSDDEIATVQTWMADNPNAYISNTIAGQDVHLIGGFGTGRSDKGDRLATSLHAFLDNNIVVRVSHKDLFSPRGGLDVPPLVETVLGEIISRADGAQN